MIADVSKAAASLERETGIQADLPVVIVGDDPASYAWVNSKTRMARQCSFNSIQHSLPVETTQDELERLVVKLNAELVILSISLEKDVYDRVSSLAARSPSAISKPAWYPARRPAPRCCSIASMAAPFRPRCGRHRPFRLFGKPMMLLLLTAVGRPKMVKDEWIKSGAPRSMATGSISSVKQSSHFAITIVKIVCEIR